MWRLDSKKVKAISELKHDDIKTYGVKEVQLHALKLSVDTSNLTASGPGFFTPRKETPAPPGPKAVYIQ